MGGMLWEQCGAQHSQVDNNGNTQSHRCPRWGPDVCEGARRVLLYMLDIFKCCLDDWVWACIRSPTSTRVCVCVFACVLVLAHWYRFTCTLAALNAALMHASLRMAKAANGKWWQNSWKREVCLWRISRARSSQVDNKEETSWSQSLSPWSTPLSSLCFYLHGSPSRLSFALFNSLEDANPSGPLAPLHGMMSF